MKKLLTAAVLVTAMVLPAFAEGDDPSTPAGEAKGSVKATTDMKQNSGGAAGAVVVPRATTGSASTNQLNKQETSSPANPGQKTGVTGGGDDKGGGSSGAGGGSGGSGSGGGSGGNQ